MSLDGDLSGQSVLDDVNHELWIGNYQSGLPASGGNVPGTPLPSGWWQLEQFVWNTLAPLAFALVAAACIGAAVFPAVPAASLEAEASVEPEFSRRPPALSRSSA